MKSATTTLVALLLAGPAFADRDGTGSAITADIVRSPVALHGELNDADGAGLPVSLNCIVNCIETAVLGGRYVVFGHDSNGTPFVAVPVDARGDWPLAESAGPTGNEFPVLDDWFISRTGVGRGVAALDGTPIGYDLDTEGNLTLSLALPRPEKRGRTGIVNDAMPGDCPNMVYGGTHEHERVAYCACYENNGQCRYTYMKVIETHDCMGALVDVDYESDDTWIGCNKPCPC